MKRLIGFLFFFFFLFNIKAQSPDDLIKKFFKEWEDNPDIALDNLYSSNPFYTSIKEEGENLKTEAKANTVELGKYSGYELIAKKKTTESYVTYYYLVKYARQPLRFIFRFYKPTEKWVFQGFTFDDDIDDKKKLIDK